ncbi:MAG: Flp pilus assembly complex ATPase component TadA [Gemmatimonadaceae bacterium]|nr:Flp pilus assembly complex ATPase component TadA [Gemmatimonadaceae bacterium]
MRHTAARARPLPLLPSMASPAAATTERIGDLLMKEGLITREQLQKALEEQKQNGTRVGYNLVKLGFIQELELTKILARQYKMPAVDLSKFEVDPRIVKLVPAEIAVKNLVLPLKRDGRTLTVAMADPTNMGVVEDLKFITRYDIFPVIAGEFTLKGVIEKHYESNDIQMSALLSEIEGLDAESDVEVVEETAEEMSATAMAAAVDDAPVVKLINAILTDAVKRGASDIHFECFEHDLRVRYRIDGALQEVMRPPKKMQPALISRFKIMSSLNIAERRVPQDGRIKLKMGKKVIDYRVSTLPTLFGEKVVLRILDKGNLTLDLEKFGIEPQAEKELMEAVQNPYGMVLVTGPTGSGKTTTLYSCISKVNSIDTNIMTAEDPVEYNLFGVNQVLVRTEIGMTFAAALKAFLRQDPNIIMLGEIRDLETGGIAIKAALTGHLVLSTLHTNSAPETVTRLLDMGLEPFNVSSALNLILAQRLLRRICGNCKVRYEPDDIELAVGKLTRDMTLRELRFSQAAVDGLALRAPPDVQPLLKGVTLDWKVGQLPYFKGKGCDTCGGSGLKGRQGAYEVMAMTPALRKLILMNVGAAEIRDGAVDGGMLTLRMDGLLKVWKGITTFEQVCRETTA